MSKTVTPTCLHTNSCFWWLVVGHSEKEKKFKTYCKVPKTDAYSIIPTLALFNCKGAFILKVCPPIYAAAQMEA